MNVDAPTHKIRWMACKNVSDETAPAFAIMFLELLPTSLPSTPGMPVCQENRDGQAVWTVKKPDWYAETMQQAGSLVANDPVPILPVGYGECTQDWPAQALYQSESSPGNVIFFVGPERDSWYLKNISRTFFVESYDMTQAAGEATDTGAIYTCWIAPAMRGIDSPYVVAKGAGSVAAGDYVKMPSTYISRSTFRGYRGAYRVDDGITVVSPGVYQFGFHGMVGSTDAPSDASLILQLIQQGVNPDGSYGTIVDLPYHGWRKNHVKEDEYGQITNYTAENVAVTGLIQVPTSAGAVFRIRNNTGYTLDLGHFMFWVLATNQSPPIFPFQEP